MYPLVNITCGTRPALVEIDCLALARETKLYYLVYVNGGAGFVKLA
jgi:hypothetical protein